jgi:hypothetical protein
MFASCLFSFEFMTGTLSGPSIGAFGRTGKGQSSVCRLNRLLFGDSLKVSIMDPSRHHIFVGLLQLLEYTLLGTTLPMYG